jgi:cytochrome c553
MYDSSLDSAFHRVGVDGTSSDATSVEARTLTPAAAASPQELRGAIFAVDNCAKCHSSDKVSPRPLKIAPPFRTLHKRYPIETFAEGAG